MRASLSLCPSCRARGETAMYRWYAGGDAARRTEEVSRQKKTLPVTDPERIIKWIPSAQPGEGFTHPVCVKCDLDMILARVTPVPRSEPARLERHFECGCGAKVTIEVPATATDDITGEIELRREGRK